MFLFMYSLYILCFFNDTAPTELYTYRHTLSLHDALPISDDRLPFLMVDNDVAGAQLFGIVRSRPDGDLAGAVEAVAARRETGGNPANFTRNEVFAEDRDDARQRADPAQAFAARAGLAPAHRLGPGERSEEHKSELQSLMRNSYAVFR